MSQPPKDFPITGLCIVADPAKCPPGYDLLMTSEDKKDDCDLWKDSLFKARVTRYLCVTRVFPLDAGRLNNVMADIVVQNEKDIPPAGYSLVEQTVDTSEKATRKKQICVKMIPRSSTLNAVTELIILSRSKRAPTGYTIAGEINGLMLCFKYGTVPAPKTGATTPSTPTSATVGNGQTNNSYFENRSQPTVMSEHHQGRSAEVPPIAARPSNNHINQHPLSGVPFQLSAKYGSTNSTQDSVPRINYRSLVDINNEYHYPFRLERGVIGNKEFSQL